MDDKFGRFVARVNANSFIPPETPTGVRKMARQIKLAKGKEFNFNVAKTGTKYPWDDWFAGNLLLLEQSIGQADDKGTIVEITEKRDYDVATDAMPPKLKTAARRRYKVVQVSRRDADGNKLDNAVIIKARDMTAEEREVEDMLRAEERVEAIQRRKDKKAGGATSESEIDDSEEAA